jgi:hypothetical protein
VYAQAKGNHKGATIKGERKAKGDRKGDHKGASAKQRVTIEGERKAKGDHSKAKGDRKGHPYYIRSGLSSDIVIH